MGKIGQDRGPAAAGRTRAGDDAHAAPGITDVAYRPAMSAPLGMDVVDFPELWARGRRRGIDLTAPQRPDFHHLIHVHPDARPLAHTVDFATHVVPPGGWLWVRPRQVHQYTAGPDGGPAVPRGLMVIWRPGFVADDPPPQAGPLVPSGAQARLVRLALDHLVAEYDEVGSLPLEAHNRTLRSLLSVLLLRLAHACPAGAAPGPPDGPFARFRAAVERPAPTASPTTPPRSATAPAPSPARPGPPPAPPPRTIWTPGSCWRPSASSCTPTRAPPTSPAVSGSAIPATSASSSAGSTGAPRWRSAPRRGAPPAVEGPYGRGALQPTAAG